MNPSPPVRTRRRMPLRRALLFVGALVIIPLLTGLLAVVYLALKDYGSEFLERKGRLAEVEVHPAGSDSLFTRSWVTLRSDAGLVVECGLLLPRGARQRYPVVILLGGKATGKHAVEYALDIKDVILVAPDYPYTVRDTYTVAQFLADVPALRRALLDMVPSVMLLTDYLFGRADVDTTRLVLLGYSFGAPLVPCIVAQDPRAAVAVLVYGGGDVAGLIRHNVRRYEGELAADAAGMLGGLLLRPLEPLRYAAQIAPMPLIMINGEDDEQIPRANVELLYRAAREPKRLVWLPSRHVNPRDVALTRLIVRTLKEELYRRFGAFGR